LTPPSTPPEKRPDRHYNFGRMNMVFALSSLALLAVTLWMSFADYAQPWKRIQSEFRSLERQKLIKEGRLQLIAVMDEAVLHRQIGGPRVMHDQLTALMEAAGLWNVTLQVIPFREGAYASMLSSFAILSFPDHGGVVYIEGLTGDLYAEGADVDRCATVFNDLRSSALSPSESIAMIRQIRDAEQQQA